MTPSEARARAHQIAACAIRSACHGDVSARDEHGDPLTTGDTERVRSNLLTLAEQHERCAGTTTLTHATEGA